MAHVKTEIFGGLSENLKLVGEKLTKDRIERPERELKLADFWKEYEQTVKAVSSECTKLTLAFNSGPQPSRSGCEMFRERVESATLSLVSAVYKLPKSEGTTLHNKIFDHTCHIIREVRELVDTITAQATSGRTTLQCTGGVWELCDSVANLPRNSFQVTSAIVIETTELVQDALSELEESLRMTDSKEGSFDEDDEMIAEEWTDADKMVCQGCIGLIKTSKSIFKKLQSVLKKQGDCAGQRIEDLELCIAQTKDASPCIDDLIEALYPPLTKEDVLCHSQRLFDSLSVLMAALPKMYFITESDQEWIEFLCKALDHNSAKVKSSCE